MGDALLELYDEALPHVYGYLVRRCGDAATAEDLTAEVFLAAVAAVRDDKVPDLSVRWLLAVARNKLVDRWRRAGREARIVVEPGVEDPWDDVIDRERAWSILHALPPHHRAALVLRYVDDLAVPDVAEALGRTVHATEALLVRARNAFRRHLERGTGA